MYSLTRNQMRLLRYTVNNADKGGLFCNNDTDYEDLLCLEELGLVTIVATTRDTDDEFVNATWVIGG